VPDHAVVGRAIRELDADRVAPLVRASGVPTPIVSIASTSRRAYHHASECYRCHTAVSYTESPGAKVRRGRGPSRRSAMPGQTRIEIRDEDFLVNGRPTYVGREWKGRRVEGLLLNSRMVQATFDDLNPDTRTRWAYPESALTCVRVPVLA